MRSVGALVATVALVAVAGPAYAGDYYTGKPDSKYGKYYAKYYRCPPSWYGPVFHKDYSKDGWGFYCYKYVPGKGNHFKAGLNVKPAKYTGGYGYYDYDGKKYKKYDWNADYKDKYYKPPY